MSIGIISSKEGHDESHINHTKLGTKFWNFEYDVTMGLNQKVLTQSFFDCRGKLSIFLRTLDGMTDDLEALNYTRWISRHNATVNDAFFERIKGVT